MTKITIDRALVEQALHVAESAGYPVALIKALRAALVQQAEPKGGGNLPPPLQAKPVQEQDVEDAIEAAYWHFDARKKGLNEWASAPQSERDAFKAEARKLVRGYFPTRQAQDTKRELLAVADAFIRGKRSAQEQAEPVAWLQPKTVDGYSRPDLGYETCSKDDYGAFPVYRVPPRCPNCASLEAQNNELDRKLAELERAEPAAVVGTQVDVWRGCDGRWAPPGEPIKTALMLKDMPVGTMLYTAPPQRKPLTEEEILKAIGWERAEMYMKLTPNFPIEEARKETIKNARAIERAVWEKNNG